MFFNRVLRIIEFIVIFIPVTILYLLALVLFVPLMIRDGDVPGITIGLLLAAPCLISCYRIFAPVMIHGIDALSKVTKHWYVWVWIGCIFSLGALFIVALEPFSLLKDDDYQYAIRMWAVGSLLNIPLAHIFIEDRLLNTPKNV